MCVWVGGEGGVGGETLTEYVHGIYFIQQEWTVLPCHLLFFVDNS